MAYLLGNAVSSIGINTTESEVEYSEDRISELIKYLQSYNDQLDGFLDLSEVVDNLSKAVIDARKKQHELEIISFFAFFSNNETILDQRKQLFFTTKMIYDAEIKLLLDHYLNMHESVPVENSASSAIENKKDIHRIFRLFTNWRNPFDKIRKTKRMNNV